MKATLIAAGLTASMAATEAGAMDMPAVEASGWLNNDSILDPGTTIQAIAANSNKNSYTSNPALTNNAWGMQGTWLSFNVPTRTSVLVTLSSANSNAPGFTVYRTDGSFTGAGTGATSDNNGAIHSFNQVGQAGTAGIVWATDDSVSNSLPGNTTANGIVETLGYVNGSSNDFTNAFGGFIQSGAHDVSIDNLYESGVFGHIANEGSINYANLMLVNLAPGYYTIFLGGTNTDDPAGGTPIDVKISSLAASPADCLFNAQESAYPELFPASGIPSESLMTYYYRHYESTNYYLGISSHDNHLYQLGPDGVLQDLGDASTLMTAAGCR
ncbi:MAG: hypothetical protein PHH11_04160 [Methylomonas sp.]|nr:hypothetical protein [Methylomonas sp.]